MSFINKSVNYSQTVLLKTSLLAPMLNSYNNFLLFNKNKEKDDIWSQLDYNIIPNNNKKFYLLICKKSELDHSKDNFNTLYFFPDNNTEITFEHEKVNSNHISDFFLEINNLFTDNFLLEGYLYNNNGSYEFLISDILFKNEVLINCDYPLRINLLNEIIMPIQKKLVHLNNHLTINLHPIFNSTNENIINIFNNNFIYAKELNSFECINNFYKSRYIKKFPQKNEKEEVLKYIERGNYTDVYNIYNIDTGNSDGILYIKGLAESKLLKTKFKDNKNITLKCVYNNIFKKWQPSFN